MLKGPRGTLVKIKILRPGQKELIPFEITTRQNTNVQC